MTTFGQGTENLISKVVDDANIIFIYTDINGTILFCNKKLQSMIAKKKEEAVGRNIFDFLYGHEKNSAQQDMFKAVMNSSIEFKRHNSFDGVIADPQNHEKLICWDITPILNEAEDLQGMLFIGTDITEKEEKEAQLKKIDGSIKEILSSQKEFGLYVTNLDGNITYYGMGSELMFGWQRDEIIFRHVSVLHIPEDVKNKLSFILEQAKLWGRHEESEINLVRKNGETFPAILSAVRFLDADSVLMGFLFIVKDITDRKKMEFQIFQSEKLAALGQLTAALAHEINNPLFVISGKLDILMNRNNIFRNINTDLKVISEQADRIRKLINSLLRYARTNPLELEELNLNSLIDGVTPLIAFQKPANAEILLEKELAPDLKNIKGDVSQLQEVFVNLIVNAYQAMPEGGRVTIRTANLLSGFAEVRISDTGCGIPEKNFKDIFMPFFSTKNEGTGLGLSICYNIVTRHNGFIDVSSIQNKGTTFILRFPFT